MEKYPLYTVTMWFYSTTFPYALLQKIEFKGMSYLQALKQKDFFESVSQNKGLDSYLAIEQ